MTAEEYRERAEALLDSRHPNDLPERAVRQAEVWACLAVSAAIAEQQGTTSPELLEAAATAVLDAEPLHTLTNDQEG